MTHVHVYQAQRLKNSEDEACTKAKRLVSSASTAVLRSSSQRPAYCSSISSAPHLRTGNCQSKATQFHENATCAGSAHSRCRPVGQAAAWCLITYNNGKTRAEQERHEHEASLSCDDGPTRTLRLPGLLMHIHPVHLHLFSLP